MSTPPPAVDPKEEAAYKAFFDASPQDADTKIKLGEDFIQTYPTSRYAESVYAGLSQAYYAKQDWKNLYSLRTRRSQAIRTTSTFSRWSAG